MSANAESNQPRPPVGEDVNASIRPPAIGWFVNVNLVALALGTVGMIAQLPSLVASAPVKAVIGLVVGLVVASLFLAFFVGLILWAGEGQNWARWAVLVLIVGSIVVVWHDPSTLMALPITPRMTVILQGLIQAVSTVFLFLPSSNRWYRAVADKERVRSNDL